MSTPGRSVLTLDGHTKIVPTLAFSPDGNRLATAGADGVVLIREASPNVGGDEDGVGLIRGRLELAGLVRFSGAARARTRGERPTRRNGEEK